MIEQRTSRYAALLLRLILGSLFIAHLYWKFEILPGGVERWWANFQTNGYPWFVPWYVISAEFAGAVLLIPGIYTRWVSLYAIPLVAGAAQFWWVPQGFLFHRCRRRTPLTLGRHPACSSIARRRPSCGEDRRARACSSRTESPAQSFFRSQIMKAYVTTTGVVFALVVVLHIWRAVEKGTIARLSQPPESKA